MARSSDSTHSGIQNPEDVESTGTGAEADPAFDDSLAGIDPDQTEYRDRMAVEDAADIGGINAELREQESQRERDVVDVLEAMRNLDAGESIKWRISRTGHENEDMNGFLDTWPTSRMTLERLRDKFGGGTYYIKGFRNGKYYVHKTITIAGPPKLMSQNAQSTQSSTDSGSNFNPERFFTQQAMRDEARQRASEEREERRRADDDARAERSRTNMIAMITGIAGAVSPIVAAIMGKRDNTAELVAALKPTTPAFGPLEMLRIMKELKDMNPDAPQVSAIDQAMSLVDRIKDMGGFSGNGQSEVGLWDIAKELAKTLGPGLGEAFKNLTAQAAAAKMIEAQRAQQPRLPSPTDGFSPAGPPSLAGPATSIPPNIASGRSAVALSPQAARVLADTAANPSSPPGQAAATQQLGDDDMLISLLPLLPWLKGETERLLIAAARGSSAELRAAAMFDDLPDDADLESIANVLSRRDWFNLFIQLDARVSQQQAFFTEVRDQLVAMIQDELAETMGAPAGAVDTQSRLASAQLGERATNPPGAPASAGGVPARIIGPEEKRARLINGEVERPAGPPALGGGPTE